MKLSVKTAGLMFAALLFGAAAPAFAEFEGVIETKMEGGTSMPMTGTGKAFFSKGSWRSEMEMTSEQTKKDPEAARAMGGKPSMRMVMVGKLSEPGIAYLVNDAAKTYSRIDTAELAKSLPKQHEGKWTVKRMGKDRVAGLPCEVAQASEEGKKAVIEVCATVELPSGEWMRAMQRQQRGGGLWMKALQDAGVHGFPIRMVMKESVDGPVTMKSEATKVERRPLPASLFEIPSGYKETGMMGAFVQSPEQAKQMEEAQRKMDEMMKNMTPEQRKQMEEMMKKMGQQKQ